MKLQMGDFMIDALTRPKRNIIPKYSTPFFKNGLNSYRLTDQFTKKKGKGGKFPKKNLVQGKVNAKSFAKNYYKNYSPITQPES